jgi:acyl-CoA thioester hydrolase
MNSDFRFFIHIDVRFRDVDALNHVNNAVYFTYMEQARVHYMKHLGLVEDYTSGFGFIIAEAACTFKQPIFLGQNVIVRIRATDLKNSSFVFEYSIDDADTGRVLAIGRTVQVCYDYEASKPVPIPAEWRARVEAFESS